jgi:hypothetical protein
VFSEQQYESNTGFIAKMIQKHIPKILTNVECINTKRSSFSKSSKNSLEQYADEGASKGTFSSLSAFLVLS